MKLFHSIAGSFLVATGFYILLAIITQYPPTWLFLLVWFATAFWFAKLPTPKHLWRKACFIFAAECFLMPVISFITYFGFLANRPPLETLGILIGGTVITGILLVVGIIGGIIFLTIGLVVCKIPKK